MQQIDSFAPVRNEYEPFLVVLNGPLVNVSIQGVGLPPTARGIDYRVYRVECAHRMIRSKIMQTLWSERIMTKHTPPRAHKAFSKSVLAGAGT